VSTSRGIETVTVFVFFPVIESRLIFSQDSVHCPVWCDCVQMPQLKPEDTTMIGLTLFNQLCQLARIANASLDSPLSDEQVSLSMHNSLHIN